MRNRANRYLLLAIAALTLAPSIGRAEAYPERPVRVVVPFPPGGGTDLIARFVARRLGASLGQQFLVENKGGAGGIIGIEAGVKSPADGYTLMLISSSYTTNPSIYKLNFDPLEDITPIIQIAQGPLLLAVNPSLHVATLGELVSTAKSNPRAVYFASSGQGSIMHLETALFASMAGFNLNHVPYRGTGPALTDTLAGQTNAILGPPGLILPYVKAGRLRALAVSAPQRLAAEPSIPTIEESGLPRFEAAVWYGLIGPRGLPSEVVEHLNGEVAKIIVQPEAVEILQRENFSPKGGTPEDFGATIKSEIALWHRVALDAGVKAQ
jgi:tripartite-type tricarboxylate transporter receptor subunit TctC